MVAPTSAWSRSCRGDHRRHAVAREWVAVFGVVAGWDLLGLVGRRRGRQPRRAVTFKIALIAGTTASGLCASSPRRLLRDRPAPWRSAESPASASGAVGIGGPGAERLSRSRCCATRGLRVVAAASCRSSSTPRRSEGAASPSDLAASSPGPSRRTVVRVLFLGDTTRHGSRGGGDRLRPGRASAVMLARFGRRTTRRTARLTGTGQVPRQGLA